MTNPVQYNDGKTAARHEVSAYPDADFLVIERAAGIVPVKWPLCDIRLIGSAKERPIRLRRIGSDERLSLDADDDGTWLLPMCRHLHKRDSRGFGWRAWTVAGLLALLSVAGIFVYLLPRFAGVVAGLVPPALEQTIGEQSRHQLLGLLGRISDGDNSIVCRNAAAQDILDRRAQEIATLMESPFPITVTVVRFPVANALALPGGEIVILSALIEKAESGDEVIGVLAHEIAHVVRRDPLRVSIKQTGTALLLSLLVGDFAGGAAVTGTVSSLIGNGYSRDAESAADYLAVTALNQLGLTARPFARFIERMGADEPLNKIVPEFLNTHPAGDERRREIARLSQGVGRALTSFDWSTVKKMCAQQG